MVTVRPESVASSDSAATPRAHREECPGENLLRRTILTACATLFAAANSMRAAESCTAKAASEPRVKWIAFYGQTGDEQVLSHYDMVFLDPAFKGSIAAVAKAGAHVCAYVSLGEIRISDTFYHRFDPAALLEENPAWPGTRRIDVRHQSWKELVLGEVIPFIIAKGFTGILLDTLDTPPYLEKLDPNGKRGMRQAAVDLVRAIDRSYPNMFLIMNRG